MDGNKCEKGELTKPSNIGNLDIVAHVTGPLVPQLIRRTNMGSKTMNPTIQWQYAFKRLTFMSTEHAATYNSLHLGSKFQVATPIVLELIVVADAAASTATEFELVGGRANTCLEE